MGTALAAIPKRAITERLPGAAEGDRVTRGEGRLSMRIVLD
jgi:hypothetical protein